MNPNTSVHSNFLGRKCTEISNKSKRNNNCIDIVHRDSQ